MTARLRNLVPAGDRHHALRPLGAQAGPGVPVNVVGAEIPGLRVGPYREILAAHPGREAQVVADARARAGLAADGLRLQHHRRQALGCPVDRGRPGRPGADHRHVVQAGPRAGPHPDGLGELSVRRVLQHPPVEHDDHRQRRRGGAGLFQQHLSRPGVGRVEAERDHVAAQQVPDLVRAGGPLLAHHPHDFGPGQVRPSPLLQQLGDRQVERLVRHGCGPPGVGVDVAERDGLQDRLGWRSVFPIDQEETLGRPVELTDPRQQLRPGHP